MLPRCTHTGRRFEWNPEPPRFGISGLVPYMRVGKMCVVGLGFFACGLGAPPPANSHLFDQLKNPARVSGSVPDARE